VKTRNQGERTKMKTRSRPQPSPKKTPPNKKQRSSNTQQEEDGTNTQPKSNPNSSVQVIEYVEDLSKKVQELLGKTNSFMKSYEECHSETSSKFQLSRVAPKHQLAQSMFNEVERKETKINLAMVGATGRGKSYIANSLALYGTPLFKKEYIDKLLPSTVDADEEYGCVTIVSFKLTYNEDVFRLKLHRRFNLDFEDDESIVSEEERKGDNQNDIVIIDDESDDDDTQDHADERIETEEEQTLYEYFHNGSLDEKLWLDQLANIRVLVDDTTDKINSGEIRLAECKFFEIEGPFPLLKSYNLSIYDIPGLTSPKDHIVNSAMATCKEANVVCLVNSMETRGQLEIPDFNLLETFVDKDLAQTPIVIFVDNVSRRLKEVGDIQSKAARKRIIDDQKVLDILLNFIQQNKHKTNFLPNINGYRRNSIIDNLLKTSFGFAFYGTYSHDSEIRPFSTFIGSDLNSFPLCTLEVCRKYLEKRCLEQARFLAMSCVFAIENDLNGKPKDLPSYSSQVKGSVNGARIVGRKQISKEWRAVCGRVIDDMDKDFTQVDISIQRLWRKRLLAIIPTDLYFDIAAKCLDQHLKTCFDLLDENLRNMFELDEDYEFPEDCEEVQQFDGLNNTFILSSAQELRHKPHDVIYLKVREALREFGNEKKQTLRSKEVLTDVQEKMSNILKTNMARRKESLDFSKALSLSKEQVMDTVLQLLTHMINRRWPSTTKELLFGCLFTPNDLLEILFDAFTASSDLAELNQSSVTQLKRSITTWKNTLQKKSLKDTKTETTKSFQPRDWVEFSHDHVDISDRDNPNTRRAQKQSERQIAQNGLPRDLPTKHFKNFVVANRIHPIFMPSYRRSKDIKKNVFFRDRTDHFEDYSSLLYLVVEDTEISDYYNSLKKVPSLFRLVFVTIPGGSRGIGFSRSMINLLQCQMSKLMKKAGNPAFEWFWIIDDDLSGVRMFNIDSQTLTMTTPCTLSLTLLQSQIILKERVDNELKQMKGSGDLSLTDMFQDEIEELLNTDDRRKLSFVIANTIAIRELLVFSTMSDDMSSYRFIRKTCMENKKLKLKFAEGLGQWLDQNMSEHYFRNWFNEVFIPSHKSQGQIVQLAVAPSRTNDQKKLQFPLETTVTLSSFFAKVCLRPQLCTGYKWLQLLNFRSIVNEFGPSIPGENSF